MSKHTPGPWHFHEQGDANHYVISRYNQQRDETDWLLALLHNGEPSNDEQTANMHLIAAAPELLELVEKALKKEIDYEANKRVSYDEWIPAAIAAIKKTKGE